MSFQIRNSQNEAIKLDELDKEVCELWGVEYNPKYYAAPKREFDNELEAIKYRMTHNWFDFIGKRIHQDKCNTWYEVIQSLDRMFNEILVKYDLYIDELLPDELKLIKYWEDKGYIPVYIHD